MMLRFEDGPPNSRSAADRISPCSLRSRTSGAPRSEVDSVDISYFDHSIVGYSVRSVRVGCLRIVAGCHRVTAGWHLVHQHRSGALLSGGISNNRPRQSAGRIVDGRTPARTPGGRTKPACDISAGRTQSRKPENSLRGVAMVQLVRRKPWNRFSARYVGQRRQAWARSYGRGELSMR